MENRPSEDVFPIKKKGDIPASYVSRSNLFVEQKKIESLTYRVSPLVDHVVAPAFAIAATGRHLALLLDEHPAILAAKNG